MIFDIKMYNTDRNIIVVRSEGYESILRHSHSFIEIVFVESGRALHNVGESCVEIKKGDVFVIATGEEHNIRPVCKESDFKIVNVVCSHELFADIEFPAPNQVFSAPNFVTRRNSRSSNRNLRRNTVRKKYYICSFATWSTVSRSNAFPTNESLCGANSRPGPSTTIS